MRWLAWWRGLSPRRRVLVAGAAAVVIVAMAAVVVTRHDGAPGATPVQDRPGPVLLVPGYGGNRDSLLALAERIRASGREAEVLALPGDGTGDLLAQADVLNQAAAEAIDRGAPSVDVIGYSAGGVVVRLWVARGGQARRVVTLGAPLHGAKIAAVGGAVAPGACPTACQQLTPGSTLLRQLEREPLPVHQPWLSIWTEDDQTVTPPDSARLDGAVNVALQQVCPGLTVQHGELPTAPLVTGMVLAALGTAPLRAPDAGACAA